MLICGAGSAFGQNTFNSATTAAWQSQILCEMKTLNFKPSH